jgi:DNA mismatch repair protein MutS
MGGSVKGVNDPRDTPAMRQYALFKKRYPDCVLLFRIGDFYELFDDDAVKVSRAIGLTLTQRTAGVPMCGLPHHQLDTYLRRLISAGFRVAVADQLQSAAEVKGNAVIQRGVTRVITPGTLVDEPLLSDDRANTLAAVCFPASPTVPAHRRPANGHVQAARSDTRTAEEFPTTAAVACVELSTGQFTVLTCPAAKLVDELTRRQVREVLYAETADRHPPPRLRHVLEALGLPGTPRPQWHFRLSEAFDILCEQFGVRTLAGFGLDDQSPEITAAGAVIRYLRETQAPDQAGPATATADRGAPGALAHLRPPRRELAGDRLEIDASSLRSLEVDRTIRGALAGDAGEGSLLSIFSGRGPGGAGSPRIGCRTGMGKRLLRDWLCRPSARLEEIATRQSRVSVLVEDRRTAAELGSVLSEVEDVQRIGSRVALGRCTPRDLVALGRSVGRIDDLRKVLEQAPAFAPVRAACDEIREPLVRLAGRIGLTCVDDPPAHLREGGLIRPGIDAALDEARLLRSNAGEWLAAYQQRLIAEHQIPTLKVGFNRIFGYYIELSKGQASRAPASFTRRQTLTGAERFITPELKAFEEKVMNAEARALERETELFASLCREAAEVLAPIAAFADLVAELDVLLCFADKSVSRGWVRPEMVQAPVLRIVQGRHPVLDELLEGRFVPNDLVLGLPDQGGDETNTPRADAPSGAPSLAIITGPNMAGKSTFIRQCALMTLLAHTGCFVPAQSATIGLCDRIFTRVGADDALFAGQSTFMVEMTETANILHHATSRSLVVLDEIGRGTSTLDGLSLAWAIAETLAHGAPQAGGTSPGRGPRTLFATHYHELTRLEELLPGRITNLHVSVREWEDQIVFLHRILPGRADRSYGIHVAKLAGIPAATVARAREVLESLTVEHSGLVGTPAACRGAGHPGQDTASPASGQLSLFTQYVSHPVVDRLRELKLEDLTPLKAFDLLRTLSEHARDT